ncbi:lipid-A-disaccharide synthase [Rhizobium sp. RU20A]|uniref:lipid-A-disaccharide synthase n=1 Tax=Rhizobium sp. RU20A TaxID=1907412 RepID=UPI00095620D8|nr:lipid-A-disaccharide synthase [Rhizobium sp. RU20A]SIQ01291.1 lipid-A-disaccharide synthase [Rhizobium sp. RU20A]
MTQAARPLKIAMIAGEVSGDLLGADLIGALRRQHAGPLSIVGVGGEAMEAEGLSSWFDYSELSIMGIAQVLKRLPQLLARIRQTAERIIAEKPDLLVIIDSPDFTHRVAKRVRKVLPDLPVVNYVCPSVWAWKPERATKMLAYVDHVLAVLPFEPDAMRALGGPATTYVGHRLVADRNVRAVRDAQKARPAAAGLRPATCLLLPGSRGSEIDKLLPVFGETMQELRRRHPDMRFVLPTVPRQEARVRTVVATWPEQPDIRVGAAGKWSAFAEADTAIAASGTVILELGLCRIPTVSTYKVDFLIRLMHQRIRTWTGALPNLIADYPFIPEYLNEAIRPGSLVRWVDRLIAETPERAAMLAGFDRVETVMATQVPAGERAAEVVLSLLDTRRGI